MRRKISKNFNSDAEKTIQTGTTHTEDEGNNNNIISIRIETMAEQ